MYRCNDCGEEFSETGADTMYDEGYDEKYIRCPYCHSEDISDTDYDDDEEDEED